METDKREERCEDEVARWLARSGGGDLDGAALALLGTMQRWRRRAARRDLERRAIADLGLKLDVASLDVLTAIWAPVNEFGDVSAQEPTVGTIAQRLGIDPSRASRIVAETIASGYARRAVSQQDARRALVELTETGQAAVLAVRTYKALLLREFLAEWSREELDAFIPLFERFSTWSEQARHGTSEAFRRERDRLAADLGSA